jgi:3-deoxy-7-phosphoheptulonate synthase
MTENIQLEKEVDCMIIQIDNSNVACDLKSFFNEQDITYKEVNYDNKTYFYLNNSLKQNTLAFIENVASNIVFNEENYYFVSRAFKPETTKIKVKNKIIGADDLTIIGGPCSVESRQQMSNIVAYLSKSATDFIRGGIFKPRTSPYSFQGLGAEGLEILQQTSLGYPIVCELTSVKQVEEFASKIDIIQVGARNMQNYELLKALALTRKPIILKRGFNARLEEFLAAAEYIFIEGNSQIILCERGIRSFENAYRNVTDINGIALLKKLTHLPIIIDPSHSTCNAAIVSDVALGCIMAGADGLIVETHYDPNIAFSDGAQSLDEEQYLNLVTKAVKLKKFINNL